jgi:hypothetical protein
MSKTVAEKRLSAITSFVNDKRPSDACPKTSRLFNFSIDNCAIFRNSVRFLSDIAEKFVITDKRQEALGRLPEDLLSL